MLPESEQAYEIIPTKLYSLSEAARLIPSCRGGHVHTRTLRQWRAEGKMQAVSRQVAVQRQWFVYGAEIIRLRGGPAPAWNGRTPAQRKRGYERAMKQLREMGVKC